MGTILAFRRSDEAVTPAANRLNGSLGEIIIFPGVRIDRNASNDSPAQTRAPSRGRAQRGRKK